MLEIGTIHPSQSPWFNAVVLVQKNWKVGFWHITMDEVSKQYTTFTVGKLDFFYSECMPFGLCNAPAELPRGTEPDIPLNQFR